MVRDSLRRYAMAMIRTGAPTAPDRSRDDARFCPACGQSAASGEGTTVLGDTIGIEFNRELRHVTAVFCDLVGSTELSSSMDAEEFSELIESLPTQGGGNRPGLRRRRRGLQRRRHPLPLRVATGSRRRRHQRADRRPRCRGRDYQARRAATPCCARGRPQRPGRCRSARWRRPSGHDVGGRNAQRVRPPSGCRRTGHGGGERGHDCPGRREVRRHTHSDRSCCEASPSRSPRFVSSDRTGARSRMDVSANRRSPLVGRELELSNAEPALGPGQGRTGGGRSGHRGARGGQVQARRSAARSDTRRPPNFGWRPRARRTPG
jgi:hypothetical protein